MFGKKKRSISDLRTACITAQLELDQASNKSLAARLEVLSIAQDIKSIDEALYDRLFAAARTMDGASELIARAHGELHVAVSQTNE